MKHITTNDVVRALKARKLSTPAKAIASDLESTSRAVATAARQAVKDGRLSWRFKKGIAFYRFVRLTAKATKEQP